jgi:hypothetical protein
MTVRDKVFGALVSDTFMNALGINLDTLYANGAPDSPADRFAVLRWGMEVSGFGNSSRAAKFFDCTIWVYDREDDYTWIKEVIERWCKVMDSIVGEATGSGWILQCDWAGDNQDVWDDSWQRNGRSSTYTIVATGT